MVAADPLPDISAHHAQQAVEKSFKAFLTARSVAAGYTHDLVRLQRQCADLEPHFASFFDAAQELNSYSTEYRYPDGDLAPPFDKAEEAVRLADEIVRFVRNHLL